MPWGIAPVVSFRPGETITIDEPSDANRAVSAKPPDADGDADAGPRSGTGGSADAAAHAHVTVLLDANKRRLARPRVVDLLIETSPEGEQSLSIVRSLEPGAYDIDLAQVDAFSRFA